MQIINENENENEDLFLEMQNATCKNCSWGATQKSNTSINGKIYICNNRFSGEYFLPIKHDGLCNMWEAKEKA